MTPEKARILAEKLKNHSDSADKIGNTEEAASFASKALELADRFGFDLSDSIKDDTIVFHFWEDIKYYHKTYAHVLAKLYGVCAVSRIRKYKNSYITLSGTEEHVNLVTSLFEANNKTLQKVMNTELKKFCERPGMSEFKEEDPSRYSYMTKEFKKSFYSGVAIGFEERIQESRNKYSTGITEIVKSSFTEAKQSYENKFGKLTSSKESISNDVARNLGETQAKSIASGAGLGSTKFLN